MRLSANPNRVPWAGLSSPPIPAPDSDCCQLLIDPDERDPVEEDGENLAP